jgi:ribonuclease HI
LIKIYTDGSCITSSKIGAWAAIIFVDDKKFIIKDIELNTTHNRMELTAVIKALEFLIKEYYSAEKILVYTDSQYVEQIKHRKEKLIQQNFITGKGAPLQNTDLLKVLIELIEQLNPEFIKVKAHQKKSQEENFNREADMLVRKLVRSVKNF